MYHDLKRDVFRNILQGLVLAKNYQSNNKRHVVNCVQQVFHQCFDHADNLQALEMCIKCDTVGFIVLIYAYTYTVHGSIYFDCFLCICLESNQIKGI